MARNKTIQQRGILKHRINASLYNNKELVDLLLDGVESNTNKLGEFKEHVNSHLFIDDTLTKVGTFIFYDISVSPIREGIETFTLSMYCICSRDILETFSKEGYYGNRADILSEMVVDTLTNKDVSKELGIGEPHLDSVGIYNSNRFYGCVLKFNIKGFSAK